MKTILIIIMILLMLSGSYLLLIMPRVNGGPDRSPFMEHYYAHRGFHDNNTDAPENSKPAFKAAVANGYGIELDVLLTKDNIPVVYHDEKIQRGLKQPGYIWDYTYDELMQFELFNSKERIPKLKEVLDIVDAKVPLIVEIKCENGNTKVCEEAYRVLKDYKGVYCIENFHQLAVRWFKKNVPHILRGQLASDFYKSGDKRPYMFVHGHLMFNFLGRPDFISYDCQYPDELSGRICKKLFKSLPVAWTIRSQQKLDEVKDKFALFIFEGFRPV